MPVDPHPAPAPEQRVAAARRAAVRAAADRSLLRRELDRRVAATRTRLDLSRSLLAP